MRARTHVMDMGQGEGGKWCCIIHSGRRLVVALVMDRRLVRNRILSRDPLGGISEWTSTSITTYPIHNPCKS